MSPTSNDQPTQDEDFDYETARVICAEQRDEALAWAGRWCAAFWGVLVVAGISLLGNIGQAYQTKVKPYYIEVSSDGRARVLGPAPEYYQPKQEVVREELRKFIAMLRRVSEDKKLMADDWSLEGIYAHVTGRGRKRLNEAVALQNPLHRKDIVAVEHRSAMALSEKTYEVRWTERRYTAKLEPLETDGIRAVQGYRGILTWTRQEPKTEEEIQHNPLGIFIDTLSIEKE